ncbi:copper homeostasis protein CutC [Rhizobium sp. TRM95111]|uniref:copper homeostasis protein CutC n=1 Tax=Rhizobium alarense TaxID=2846851 RepID=UPI001F393FB8|nr:copper homeostasis protein CutC [Rhizobium alarense]MCF3640967.1 copper homeostasis protein CutC [Rhizobium alarense]
MPSPLIEICVEGIDGFLAAQAAGADRVELCASLMEGGLTPSLATIRAAVRAARIPVHVIIRPRGGDFLYSDAEFETMREDIVALRGEGVAGVVIGCLTPDGRIDEERMAALVEAARPMSVTCHRAFDMTADVADAVEALVRCGIDRVLTSGQRDTAVEGLDILRQTVALAAGRLVVMGCGALDAGNIRAVRDGAGLAELHFAALTTVASAMRFRNPHVGMGGTEKDREYELTLTDGNAVRATIAAARG